MSQHALVAPGEPPPEGSGLVRRVVRHHPSLIHLLRGVCLAAALALWAGLAIAGPAADSSRAGEEAVHQPLNLEWGAPSAGAAGDAVSDLLPRGSLSQAHKNDWGALQTVASVQLSRARFDGEAARDLQPLAGDLAANPHPQVEIDRIAYHWWFARGSNSVGLGVGAVSYRVNLAPDLPGASGAAAMGAPLISVALRHRVSKSSLIYLDAASARQLGADDAGEFYGTRAGVEWKTSPNSSFVLEQGRVRLRLYSSASSQMSLRVRHGGPVLVYRMSFY